MARYIELLVRGDDRDLKPYLAGYATAVSGLRIAFADDAGFHIRQLRERIRHHGEVLHVIVLENDAPRVRGALDVAPAHYRHEIVGERSFEHVHFAFEFDTPSQIVAEKVKALLKQPPAGLALENYTQRERTDPEAASAEIYTPEHHYDFEGRGTVRGDVFAAIDLRAAMCGIDFVRCTEIIVDRIQG